MAAFTVIALIGAFGPAAALHGGTAGGDVPAWLIHPAAATSATAGPSFDCAAASSQVETMICSDAALGALDRRLAERFAAAIAAAENLGTGAGAAVDTLRATQRGWIGGRNDCWKAENARSCIEDAYLRREGELVAEWMLETPFAVVRYTCEGNPANEATLTFFDTELPAVRIEYGDGVDVGTVVISGSGSKYEASFGRFVWLKGDDMTFAWTEGDEMSCTSG